MTDTIVVLDTESTGLSTRKDRLVELAAIRYNLATRTVADSLHLLVNPKRTIPAEATKVHGITDADVADKPNFEEIADQLVGFVDSQRVVIHNAQFDVGLLDTELSRVKRPALSAVAADITCSLRMARQVFRGKTVTLDALCDLFGIDRSHRTTHGALIDCELLAEVFVELEKRYKAMTAPIESVLGFGLADDISGLDLQALCDRAVAIDAIDGLLAGARKVLEERVRELCQGEPFDGDGVEVAFTQRNNVDWKAVTKDHLAEVDLEPYRKPTSAMSIRAK